MPRERSVSFESIAPVYDATRGGPARGAALARAVRPFLDPPVLEVGVGTGVVAAGMGAGLPVAGVDISPAMLGAARARLGPVVALADAEHLPYTTGAFGGAYGVWVLHLVRDVPRVLAEVARVLRPGGRFAVVGSASAEPDRVDAIVERMRERLWGPRPDEPDRLAALARAAGWREVASTVVPAGEVTSTPRESAQRYRRRELSVVLGVDADRWDTVVEPALREIETLPDADVPRTVRRAYHVLVLERPARGAGTAVSGGTSAPA